MRYWSHQTAVEDDVAWVRFNWPERPFFPPEFARQQIAAVGMEEPWSQFRVR
jgi:hypothetical protein